MCLFTHMYLKLRFKILNSVFREYMVDVWKWSDSVSILERADKIGDSIQPLMISPYLGVFRPCTGGRKI